MFDPDPQRPALRLAAPRKASQPTELSDKQHLARLAQADPIAVRHSVGADAFGQFVADWSDPVYRAFSGGDDAPVLRLRVLRKADADLAQRIDDL